MSQQRMVSSQSRATGKNPKNAVTGGGASVVALESLRATTVHNNQYAARTTKTYRENIGRLTRWCDYQVEADNVPDDLPKPSLRLAFRSPPDAYSPRVLTLFLTGLHSQHYVPNTLYSYIGAARKFWQEMCAHSSIANRTR